MDEGKGGDDDEDDETTEEEVSDDTENGDIESEGCLNEAKYITEIRKRFLRTRYYV